MSKTQIMYVPGKIMWAKGLIEADKEYAQYNAQLVVTDEWKSKVLGAGCEAEFHPVENGHRFKIKSETIRKVLNPETKKYDKEVEASPPDVFITNPEGKNIDVDPRTVGNGSDVTVKLEMYDTKRGRKGTRLKAVRVENLIEFKPQEVEIIGDVEVPF